MRRREERFAEDLRDAVCLIGRFCNEWFEHVVGYERWKVKTEVKDEKTVLL